jgi:hypothetical protein
MRDQRWDQRSIGRIILNSVDHIFLFAPLREDAEGFELPVLFKGKAGLARDHIKGRSKNELEIIRWALVSTLANVIVVRDEAGLAKAIKHLWPALAPSTTRVAARLA